jgi:hypothetical protein
MLAGCRGDPNDQFIQGTWYFRDPHFNDKPGESQQETWWAFDRGTYEFSSCCFVESEEYGRYEIIQSEGDELVLELFHRDGRFNSERTQISITIDREEDGLKIQRGGLFERVRP